MMADLIDRQAAIDAILHNQEVYSNNFGNDPIDKYTIAIIDNDAQTIAQLPSAQPEIIRCKDCKHYRSYAGILDGYCHMAEWYKRYQYENDYCSRGERKE